MVKYYILVLLYSTIFVHSQNLYGRCTGNPSSANECINIFTDEERSLGYYCCLEKGNKDGVEKSKCTLLAKEDHDNINEYINDLRDAGYNNPSVVCETSTSHNYSNYLHLGILSLLSLFYILNFKIKKS